MNIEKREELIKDLKIKKDIKKNIEMLKNIYGDSFNFNIRRLKIGVAKKKAAVIYLAGLTDTISIDDVVKYLKEHIKNTYGKKGKDIVDMNYRVVDMALEKLNKIIVSKNQIIRRCY